MYSQLPLPSLSTSSNRSCKLAACFQTRTTLCCASAGTSHSADGHMQFTWISARDRFIPRSSNASDSSSAPMEPDPSASIRSKQTLSCAFCPSVSFGLVFCKPTVLVSLAVTNTDITVLIHDCTLPCVRSHCCIARNSSMFTFSISFCKFGHRAEFAHLSRIRFIV